MDSNLEQILTDEGYENLREVKGKGACGLFRFIYTIGLVYGCDETGYVGRYCFEKKVDAAQALTEWDGNGDPNGNWIKHKGHTEYPNPNRQEKITE